MSSTDHRFSSALSGLGAAAPAAVPPLPSFTPPPLPVGTGAAVAEGATADFLSRIARKFRRAAPGGRHAAVWLVEAGEEGDEGREGAAAAVPARLRCAGADGARANETAGQVVLLPETAIEAARRWRTFLPESEARAAGLGALLPCGMGGDEVLLLTAPLFSDAGFLGFLVAAGEWGGSSGPALAFSPLAVEDAEEMRFLADSAAMAVANTRLEERLRRDAERQALLNKISACLQQTLDLNVLIPIIFDEVNKAIEAEGQSIWLLEEAEGVIVCRFATGPGAEQVKQVAVPLGQGIVGNTVLHGQAMLIADVRKDQRHYRKADQKTGLVTRSLMSVPMIREGRAIGGIQAINKRGNAHFTQDDLDLFRRIADIAAMAIENARLYAALEASYDSTLDALTGALDLRDRETEGHSRRVVEIATRIAQEMGLNEESIKTLRRGALLHDIGKIGIPDSILLKPDRLSPDERTVIEQHPLTGFEMLLGIPYLSDEIRVVVAHQEKWDGTGYPFGLAGEAIPPAARIFAVADTFDAITSNRPYRAARSFDEACAVIAAEAGSQFDPRVVKAFLAVPSEDWAALLARVQEETRRRQVARDGRIKVERFRAAQRSEIGDPAAVPAHAPPQNPPAK